MTEIREMEIAEEPEIWTCPYCKLKLVRTKLILIRDGMVEEVGHDHKLAPGQYGMKIGVVERNHNLHKCRLNAIAISNGYTVGSDKEVCWNCKSSEVDMAGYGEPAEMYCRKFSEKGRIEGYKWSRWVSGNHHVTPTGDCDSWERRKEIRDGFRE